MELYRLDVARQLAGKAVAFDRVYLARGDAKRVLKALFKFALVLPMTSELRDVPRHSVSTTYTEQPLSGRAIGPVAYKEQELFNKLTDEFIVVVPIAPNHGRKRLPTYLTNARWAYNAMRRRTRRGRTRPPAGPAKSLPVLSYLQTPEKNYRPICIACPRFTEFQAGMCTLGMRVCYETLVLGDVAELPDASTIEAPGDFREVSDG